MKIGGGASRLLAFPVLLYLACSASPATAQRSAFERPPINYLEADVDDPVAKLADRIQQGDIRLEYDAEHGYLPSLLRELSVPVSSQTLVFSKTSLQLHRISPRRPRALYFNDNVYVGFCKDGDVLEIAATDADQGAIFYTLEQAERATPKLVRDRGQCLTCHASSRTQDVPGYLVRSVFADAAGRPKYGSGTFTTDHTSDFRERWGGWYVTGTHGKMRHMGNTICKGDETTFDRSEGANKESLEDHFQTNDYLSPHSDIVALMVLGHQTQMHNAIAAANYETRQALHQCEQMNEILDREPAFVSPSARRRIDAAAENVVEHLLMRDEFVLTDPVAGTTSFAKEFAAGGHEDSQGRSLRELDLETRLFRYPCSFLIHSDAFNALPEEVRTRISQRLLEILDGGDAPEGYAHLTPPLRRAVLEILGDTKPELIGLADRRNS